MVHLGTCPAPCGGSAVGLNARAIKSGKFKDAGNPARPLTPAERQLFQQMIQNVYQQFLDDVLTGRKAATGGKLTRQKLLQLADGRVYTGQQAKNNLLVDANGGLYEAILEAQKRGGMSGEPKVKKDAYTNESRTLRVLNPHF